MDRENIKSRRIYDGRTKGLWEKRGRRKEVGTYNKRKRTRELENKKKRRGICDERTENDEEENKTSTHKKKTEKWVKLSPKRKKRR